MSPAPSMNDLFAAARGDAPSDAQHDAMWGRVATATGVAAGAATASAGAAKTTTVIGGKLLALGGLIGAAGTVLGVLVTTQVITPAEGRTAPGASAAPAHVIHAAGAKLADTRTRAIDPAVRDRDRAKPAAVATAEAAAPLDNDDLAVEAKLVTEARQALVSGDATRALTTVRTAKRLRARVLQPEELSLEARALHALGRADEAAAAELELRRLYPDHALAR